MTTVAIKIDGTDQAPAILFASCYFMSAVNGVAGEAHFRIRDPDRSLTIVPGSTVELLLDGGSVWYGFVTAPKRVYAFPAIKVTESWSETRFIDVECTDINVLFQKRIVFNQTTPEDILSPLYAPHTADTTAITDLLADWLDLSGDGLDTSSGVVGVGDINEDQDARPWSGSDTWGDAMRSISLLPASIYYIRPNKELAYVDTDTPDAPFGLSDQPNGTTKRGYSEMEILLDGSNLANDVMCWGIGYGSTTPVFKRDIDATSVTDHGVWQLGQVTYGIYKQATIDRVADSIINGSPDHHRGSKDDRPAVMLTTYEPGLLPAQKVSFESNVFGWDEVLPIRKMEVSFEAPDHPKYQLTLSQEIDTPWSFFDPWKFRLPRLPRLPQLPNLPQPGQAGCTCGITDAFNRTVVGGLGRSDFGVDWDTSIGGPAAWSVAAGVATAVSPIGALRLGLLRFDGRPTSTVRATGQITASGAPSSSAFWALAADSQPDFAELDFATDGTAKLVTVAGTSTTTLSFTATSKFNVLIVNDGANARAKVWLATDPEPAGWTLTQAFMTAGLFDLDVYMYVQANATATTGTFASIDAAGINRCVAPLFEDFERTETGVWGDATPGGQLWTQTAGVNSTARVASGQGVMENDSAFLTPSDMTQSVDPGLTPGGDFTATIFLKVTSDTNVNEAAFIFDDFSFGWAHSGGTTELFLEDVPTGGFRVTVAFDPTFWANLIGVGAIMKAQRIGGTARLKLWDSALAEPGWMLAGSSANHTDPATIPGAALFSSLSQGVAGVQSVSIASIDFGYARRPCYFGCATLTTVFDDFNRVTDAGNTPWTIGDASYRPPTTYPWSPAFGGGSSTPGLIGTDGQYFFATSGWNFSSVATGLHDGSDPWAPDVFTLRTRFQIDTTPNAASNIGGLLIIGFTNVNLALHIDDRTWNPGGLFGGALEIGTGPTTVPGTYVFPKNDWVGGTWYIAELLHDSTNTITKARVYIDGTAPPAWQVTRASASTLTGSDISLLLDTYGSGHLLGYKIMSDYIEFDTEDCATPVGPFTGAPLAGSFCEPAARTDSTHYQLSRSIAPLSSRVYIGTPGLLLLNGTDYTEDPATGIIVFTSPVPIGTNVYVCYTAAGLL